MANAKATYKIVDNGALWTHCATANEMKITGLQGIALPTGFTSETVTITEMGVKINKQVPTGGTYDESSLNYNYAPGNPAFKYLENCSKLGTDIQDMRFYLDDDFLTGDFAAVDLISDPTSCYRIGTISAPTGDKGQLLTGTVSIVPAGPSGTFTAHASGTDLVFSAGKVTSTNTNFLDAGFESAMTLIVDWYDSEDPLYLKVASVTQNEISFVDGEGDYSTIGAFTGVAKTAIHGAWETLA